MSLGISRGFRFALYGLAVFILAAAMYSLAKPSTAGSVPDVSEVDHARGGDATAPVTIIEYSDFQCPACGSFEPLVQSVSATYGDRVRIIYRHFPLSTLHPNAEAAAFASEAAAMQGKFWEMHDLLFDRQKDWDELDSPTDMFAAYAGLLELDVTQFTSDLTSDAVKDRVQIDVASGNAAGISATPTFYLNGQVIDFPANANPATYLTQQIDAALAAAQVAAPSSPEAPIETETTP